MTKRGDRIRVLVVDDSPFMRKSIQRMLDSAPDIEVIGTAASGELALEALERLRPDVVTLDVVLPGADGITVLEQIMATRPLPVLMLSSLTTRDAETTVAALEKGAVDVVAKPVGYAHMDMPLIAKELISKVRSASDAHPSPALSAQDRTDDLPDGTTVPAPIPAAISEVQAVIVGASTGGPPALNLLVSSLPSDFPSPMLLVQHMPRGFTAAFAERLDRHTSLRVTEANDGDLFERGRIFVAPSGKHVTFETHGSRVVLRLSLRPTGLIHMPSIDVAMRSAAHIFGKAALGVLLTGMGQDGAHGLLEMRERGAFTITETESSAVVWGMPRAAVELDAASLVAHLRDIPRFIVENVTPQPEQQAP